MRDVEGAKLPSLERKKCCTIAQLRLTLLACWTLRRRYSYSKLSENRSRNRFSRSLCVMFALFKASADTFDAKYCTTLRAKSLLAARACRSLNSTQSVPNCEFSISSHFFEPLLFCSIVFAQLISQQISRRLTSHFFFACDERNQNKDFFTVKCAIFLAFFTRNVSSSLLFTLSRCFREFASPCDTGLF